MVTGKQSKIGSNIAIGVLTFMSLAWIFPILWTLFQSLRPYGDVLRKGYVSMA
jgi:ABC-type glycerol-3-phosphate transport system permease component